MSDGTIEDALRITLADYRLTRGEKRALSKVVEKIGHDQRLLALARATAFQLARAELRGPENADLMNWLEDVMKVLQWKEPRAASTSQSEAYFSPDDGCVSRIIRLFASARQSVDVCVFTITDDRITDAILDAHRRGVSIRIISDNDKAEDRGSDVNQLDRLGIPVRVDRSEYHMHHKYAIYDRHRLLTGSYNWTRSAARNNEENFILTSDAQLLKSFRNSFEELWRRLQ